MAKPNPRRSNGSLRTKQRERLRSLGLPCGICHGARGPIRYDQPSDWRHPYSFVVDEVVPVSRWREGGYPSPEACALDPANQQPAHWCCNAEKGNGKKKKLEKGAKKPIGKMAKDATSRAW